MSKQLVGCDSKSCRKKIDFKKKLVKCLACDDVELLTGYGSIPEEEQQRVCQTPRECNWIDQNLPWNTLEPKEICFYCKRSR